MRVETLQRPRKEATGSRHEPGVVRQTAPADVESIATTDPRLDGGGAASREPLSPP